MSFQYKIKENFPDFLGRLYGKDSSNNELARTITIQVTDACNLCCSYCYQINKKNHVIDKEIAFSFIRAVLNGDYDNYCHFLNSTGIILEFIGGEPFLQIDLIDEITNFFIQELINRQHPFLYKYKISICSNGTLYFDPRVQAYIQKHHQHLSFTISIDGNKELHDACRVFPDGSGSYDLAIKAVQHYTKTYGIQMGSKMTLSPNNIHFLSKSVKDLVKNNYSEIHLNCVYEEGWTIDHAKILYQELKELTDWLIKTHNYNKIQLSIFQKDFFRPKDPNDLQNWCGGTGEMLAVDWKGDLYPCIRYMESSLGSDVKPLIIGNVKDGILHTEEQCRMCKELQEIDRRTQSTDECFNCPIAEGCSWCSAYNYQKFGTANHRATFICVMHKARALANSYYWNKVFRIEFPNQRMKLWIPKEQALEIIDEDEWKLLKWLESSEQLN